jgi:hypothetical protein
MAEKIDITLAGGALPFDIDFENKTWTTVAQLDEGDFPIFFEARGKRWSLYSNGTFDEEEKP